MHIEHLEYVNKLKESIKCPNDNMVCYLIKSESHVRAEAMYGAPHNGKTTVSYVRRGHIENEYKCEKCGSTWIEKAPIKD